MTEINSLCRLCSASVKENGLCIFGEIGRKSLLQSKIKLYLHFSVAENDDLPKTLCTYCVRKLESIHRFASMSLCMQDRLRLRLGLQSSQNSDIPSPRNLLQSVHIEQSEKKDEGETDCEVMEMEMDPMSILDPGYENDICVYGKAYGATEQKSNNSQGDQLNLQNKPHSRSRMKPCPSAVAQRSRKKKHKESQDEKGKHKERKEPGVQNNESEPEPEETECFDNDLSGASKKSLESQSESECRKKNNLDEQFGCSMCSRMFKSKANLEQHLTYHKVWDYTCKDCGRVYATKSTLRSHLVTHSDVRPHKCAVCPKTFKRNQDLKFHINQHTGERPYLCPFCPKAFASSGNCFSHRKRMHPQENIDGSEIMVP